MYDNNKIMTLGRHVNLGIGYSEGILDINVDYSSFIIENNYKVVTNNKELDNVHTLKYDIGLYNTK